MMALSSDLVAFIFTHLLFKDLLSCAVVCKFFRTIISDDARLQYTIELAASGLVETAKSNRVSTGEILGHLTESCNIWKSRQLALVNERSVECNLQPRLCVDQAYSEGTVAFAFASEDNMESCWVHVYRADGIVNGIQPRIWQSSVYFNAMCIDAVQDYFWGLSWDPFDSNWLHIHTLSLSTGVPRGDVITINAGALQLLPRTVEVQVRKHVMVLRITTSPDDRPRAFKLFLALDWRTGNALHTVRRLPSGPWGWCLPSPDILLTSGLYNAGPRSESAASVDVHFISSTPPDEASEEVSPAATFVLPSVAAVPHHQVCTLELDFLCSAAVGNPSQGSLHTTSPEMQLLGLQYNVLTFDSASGHQQHRRYVNGAQNCFFTPVQTFINFRSFLDKLPDRPSGGPPVIPWEVWGPVNTRCCAGSYQPGGIFHGWQVAMRHRILSFNQTDIRKDSFTHPSRASDCAWRKVNIMTEPTRLLAGCPFVREVVTSLPYRECVFKRPIEEPFWYFLYNGRMITTSATKLHVSDLLPVDE